MQASQITTYAIATTLLAVVIHTTVRISRLIQKRVRDRKALSEFPILPGHWLFGNINEILKLEDALDWSLELNHLHPKMCVIRLDPFRYQLRLNHPETIKTVLNSPEPKDAVTYRFLEPWIGDGLLISKGQKWARNRRLLTPAFHFDILKPYVTVFSQSANVMVDKWRRMLKRSDQPMELFEHVSLMTLDSLMKCIFGFTGDCQQEGYKHPYIKGVYELAELITQRFRFFPYHNDMLYHLTWSGYKFRRACRTVQNYSNGVIQAKKRTKESSGKNDLHLNGYTSDKKYLDFLDMLLDARDEAGNGLTDSEIQAEVDTFMFEGHDTTASGISWCLYNLARHPEYQAKCRDEVNSVLGDKKDFEWEDIPKLSFVKLCVKESLRLHPPVPNIARFTTKPMTFSDGRTIPEGTCVGISIYGCHHNPHVWENPEVFDPYRFTPENSKGRSPHAYIPFSAGPRNCIGQHFALHEIKASVGIVLRNFELIEDKSQKVIKQPMLVIRAKGGLRIKLKPLGI